MQQSVAEMEIALRDLENPPPGADLKALQRAFDDASSDHERAKAKVTIAEGRSRLSVLPVAGDSDDYEGRSLSLGIGREPLTYERYDEDGSRSSTNIFTDLYRAKYRHDADSIERLQSHHREMDALGKRLPVVPGQKRAISSTAGAGGEFIPPVYLQDEWIKLPRPGRTVVNTLNSQEWIPGTNSINLPKVNSGTTVAVQTDGGAVSSTDITTGEVTGAVQTIAGQQDVSQQLVDLSVPGIDIVIFDDLVRAYDAQIDVKGISGTVANAKGLDQVASTNGITYTSSTPTAALLYPKLLNAIAQIHTGIYESPNVIAMHPLRWASILASVDTNGRPLVVPMGAPGYNALALQGKVAPESVVGNIVGLPVVVDPNIPTTLGTGTNQDEILVYASDQIYFYESTPVLRVFEEVLSNTLQVRFQMYGYYAIIAGRLPKAISVISGTGLTAPVF